MRARVVRAYTDRVTHELHRAGETVTLTAARARELEAAGRVEAIETKKKAADEAEEAEG